MISEYSLQIIKEQITTFSYDLDFELTKTRLQQELFSIFQYYLNLIFVQTDMGTLIKFEKEKGGLERIHLWVLPNH